VLEPGGTITVVLLFCGAGGLLLLMHPDNAASARSEASIVFMLNPLNFPEQIYCATSMRPSALHWIRPGPVPGVGDLLQSAEHGALGAVNVP
jgi:hypothetical protein